MADLDQSRGGDIVAIGIDVGGTKILGVVAGRDGRPIHRLKTATPRDPAAVPLAIGDAVEQLLDRVGPVAGVGVGVPGLVDNDGVLRYGPNVPGVVGFDVPAVIGARFELPVVAENDASCAAVAEHRLGAARGHDHAVVVTQGTGIGGGLIVNGALLRGTNGFAGEPGHMLVDRSGPVCACGTRGCWEAVASGAGLANLARQLVAEGRAGRIVALAGGDPGHIRGEHVAAALAGGDPDAGEVLDSFASWVAQGLASLINLLDPGIIVLGGGLTLLSEHFLPDVQARTVGAVLGGAHRPVVPVVAAELGPEAGAVGAALLAIDG
ncbi:MAG: ROK family protein [Acidimicrobiales bacterium]